MSRWWPNRLRLALGPPAADGAWVDSIEALRKLIEPRCELTVVVSSHFARYSLLPWRAELRSRTDWLAYAAHLLERAHGASAGRRICVCPTARRGPWLACAMEETLIEALRSAAHGAGARLVSLQPWLMRAFNGARRDLRGVSAWLALREAGRLTLAAIVEGDWRSVRCRRVNGHWREQMQDWIERESLVSGDLPDAMPVLVHSEETMAA